MRRAHVRLVCTLLLLAAGLVGSAGCAGPRIVTETKIRGLGGEPCTSASENATRYDAACMSVTIDVTARPTKLTGTPTGIIDFKDGATAIGTAPLGPEGTAQATFEFFFGAHEISVVYSGDSSFAGSTSETEVVEVRNQIKIAYII